jgi:hypothetical protein
MKQISMLLLMGLAAWGQSEKARIVGIVTDITGR